MDHFDQLTNIQKNILIASIMGDGEITKIYKGSRRKNNSYREHFGMGQIKYREWKMSLIPDLFYITAKSNTLRTRSLPLFTELYPYFYNKEGRKQLPIDLLKYINSPMFLAIIYMDDGTLSISKRHNHLKKSIYLTPNINLYLQNYTYDELQILKSHIFQVFGISFSLNKRKDGFGHILRLTSTKDTYSYLNIITEYVRTCPSMYYKTNWTWRLKEESIILINQHPTYQVIASHYDRHKNYTDSDIQQLISMKNSGMKDKEIALALNRSYWSIVYKLKEIRKDGLL
ncbi:DNA endonuclease [Bacillus sp. PS06]|uniref:DNA endonuclease n=1 Tax=Bacillus sp. PS06 TaxID=2764176 RepID=UPI001781F849|nr:DNA endonuclease [Bacillus sp. PS06]MBD8071401.1 DNA endonuclease [Bacillus sp. PS06]